MVYKSAFSIYNSNGVINHANDTKIFKQTAQV